MSQQNLSFAISKSSWKRRLLLKMQEFLYWSGGGFAYLTLGGFKGATILMYHSVASSDLSHWIDPSVHLAPEIFEKQMSFLAHHRHVISLSQLLETLKQGETPASGTVVITFDDGYLDNMTVAAPILERYGLKATWYLPTGMINREENHWIDRIYTIFRTRSQAEFDIEGIGHWNLQKPQQAFTAYNQLKQKLISLPFCQRQKLLTQLQDQLKPTKRLPRLVLSWDDVRKVISTWSNIEIGLHSYNHIDYSSQSLDDVRMDLQQSVDDFHRELQKPPKYFAFPYNRHCPEARNLLRTWGLDCAMGQNNETLITTNTDYFALPRIDTSCSMTLFRFYTSGAFPGLPKLLLNRAA